MSDFLKKQFIRSATETTSEFANTWINVSGKGILLSLNNGSSDTYAVSVQIDGGTIEFWSLEAFGSCIMLRSFLASCKVTAVLALQYNRYPVVLIK